MTSLALVQFDPPPPQNQLFTSSALIPFSFRWLHLNYAFVTERHQVNGPLPRSILNMCRTEGEACSLRGWGPAGATACHQCPCCWRNLRFSLKALICMAEVTWSALLQAPYRLVLISEQEAIQRDKTAQNPRQSGRDCVMLIWRMAGTFGSDLAPL